MLGRPFHPLTLQNGVRPPVDGIQLNQSSSQARGLTLWAPVRAATGGADYGPNKFQALAASSTTFRLNALQDVAMPRFTAALNYVYSKSLVGEPNAGGRMSFAAWVYLFTYTSPLSCIFGDENTGAGTMSLEFRLSSGNLIQLQARNGGVNQTVGTGANIIPLNRPVLIGLTWNGAEFKTFMDGCCESRTNTAFTTADGGVANNYGLGACLDNVRGPDGFIWDFRWWNGRVLSDNEMHELYNPRTRFDLYWRPARTWWNLTVSGGTTISGVLSATGVGTATWVGAKTATSVLAASGSGTSAWTGTKLSKGVLAATGSGTATWTGRSMIQGALAASGSGTLAAVGAKRATGALAASGSGTLTAVGAKRSAGVLAAVGSGTLTAVPQGTITAVWSASGVGAMSCRGQGGAGGGGQSPAGTRYRKGKRVNWIE